MSAQAVSASQSDYCQRNAPGTAFIVMSSILFGTATIAVPLRLWTRLRIKESTFGPDDICLVAAYAFAVPTMVLLWQMSIIGLGRHVTCYSDQDLIDALKYEYIAEVLMIFSTMFSRASVGLFVTRLFAVTKRLRIVLQCYIAFMCISLVITACLILALCTPIEALWNYHLLAEAKCWSKTALYAVDYYNSAVSILSDFLLATIPAYFLSKLQMANNLKLGLTILMAIGVVPMICAICRTAYASTQTLDADPLYYSAILLVFGSTETLVLIICASVPAMRPLFRLVSVRIDSLKNSLWSSDASSKSSTRKNSLTQDSEKNSPTVEVTRTWSVHHAQRDSDDNTAQNVLGGLTQNRLSSV